MKMINDQMIFLFFTLPIVVKLSTVFDHYFDINRTAKLECSISSASWTGPPSTTLYAVGLELTQDGLTQFGVSNTNNSSILTIKRFTQSNEGVYICYNFMANCSYNVYAKKNPTNISIENTDKDGNIHFRENELVILDCRIDPGKPMGFLKWIHNKLPVKSDNCSVLQYRIMPSMDDNGDLYTCQACDNNNVTVLSKDVTLLACGRPFIPTLLKGESTSTDILVSWIPGYDGGYPQNFVIEYRAQGEETWMNATSSYSNRMILKDLSPGSKYFIRMYALNQINSSDRTREIPVTTLKDERLPFTPNVYYAFLIIPGFAISAFVVCVFARGKDLPGTATSCLKIQREEPQGQNDVVDVGPGAIANDMYGHPLNHSSNRHNDEFQVYSSFDRRHNITLSPHAVSYDVRPKPRPDRTRKKKATEGKHRLTTNSRRQSDATDNTTPEPHELNYVEVTFDPRKEESKLRIHGQNQKTDYVDIDFTKKLREPPDQQDDDDFDEDFENAYELKKMKRRTNYQE